MNSFPGGPHAAVSALYQELLDCWNQRSASRYASLFTEDGNVIGFDGSQMNGRQEIAAELQRIFTDHQTAAYIGKIREVRFLSPGAAVLRAVVGMVSPGRTDLNPATNAVQTLVAVQEAGAWRIGVFQNTPAAFHGRPELAEALREAIKKKTIEKPGRQG